MALTLLQRSGSTRTLCVFFTCPRTAPAMRRGRMAACVVLFLTLVGRRPRLEVFHLRLAAQLTPSRQQGTGPVGDAEREGALSALREHYAQGRLDAAELEERITAALAARTRSDLARPFFDLPGERRAWPPAPRRWSHRPLRLAGRVSGRRDGVRAADRTDRRVPHDSAVCLPR
jgi:hypothetical protein